MTSQPNQPNRPPLPGPPPMTYDEYQAYAAQRAAEYQRDQAAQALGRPVSPDATFLPSAVPAPAPKPKRNLAGLKAVGLLVLFVVGCMIGAAGASGGSAPAGDVTPSSCKEALAIADQGFNDAADVISAASDGFTAISKFDSAGVATATEKIKAANAKLVAGAPKYQGMKAECLSH